MMACSSRSTDLAILLADKSQIISLPASLPATTCLSSGATNMVWHHRSITFSCVDAFLLCTS